MGGRLLRLLGNALGGCWATHWTAAAAAGQHIGRLLGNPSDGCWATLRTASDGCWAMLWAAAGRRLGRLAWLLCNNSAVTSGLGGDGERALRL